MTGVVIFGAGKIADVVYSSMSDSGDLSIAAFTCDRAYIRDTRCHGLPVVPFDEVQTVFPPSDFGMFVAIGYQNLNAVRAERCAEAQARGYRLISWVSPRAHAPKTCSMGANCLIMEGASLQPYASLGHDVFVWSGAVVGHHATVRDHAWLASNCTISSTTTVGSHSFVGVNAAIGHAISLGPRNIVGAGAVVTQDTPADAVYVTPDTERLRLDSQRFMKISRLAF